MSEGYVNSTELVAACGLYCGSCKVFVKGNCKGCRDNEKASWCKVRSCVIENGYKSCADCKLANVKDCKKFNNFMSKVFGLVFRSDRAACIERIRSVGYDKYTLEMFESKRQTIKK